MRASARRVSGRHPPSPPEGPFLTHGEEAKPSPLGGARVQSPGRAGGLLSASLPPPQAQPLHAPSFLSRLEKLGVYSTELPAAQPQPRNPS